MPSTIPYDELPYRPCRPLALPIYKQDQGQKQRSGLVLVDTGNADVVVACSTSSLSRGGFDVELAEWHRAGLLASSIVRVHKLLTPDKGLIAEQLDTLTPGDWAPGQLR